MMQDGAFNEGRTNDGGEYKEGEDSPPMVVPLNHDRTWRMVRSEGPNSIGTPKEDDLGGDEAGGRTKWTLVISMAVWYACFVPVPSGGP